MLLGPVTADAGHEATAVKQYTGCLTADGDIKRVAEGSEPAKPCVGSMVTIHLSAGDITEVETLAAGGLQGGGANGKLSLELVTCSGGQVLKYDAGVWGCAGDVDTNTTYSAGTGLALSEATFHIVACSDGQVLKYDADASGWSCAEDNDTDTTYSVGTGLALNGTELSVVPCGDGEVLKYSTGAGAWGCAADVDTDTDTTYSAGTGLSLNGTELRVMPCAHAQVLKYDFVNSTWVCASDNNTTYLAGTGLALSGTTFNVTGAPWSGLTGVPPGFADGIDNETEPSYCEAVASNPRSYPSGPCQSVVSFVDFAPSTVVGQHTSIAIGVDGLPIISYYDATAGALKVAHCNDPACMGRDETITTIDDVNDVGMFSSIAIGRDGFPVISYYDNSAGALKVAKCVRVACDGLPFTTTVDNTSAIVGLHTSIEIAVDGRPIISYSDARLQALKVAYCNDAGCLGGDETITTFDAGGNVEHTSIAIGVDGRAVISYYQGVDDDLKVVHCNDIPCTDASMATVDGSANDVGKFNSIAIGTDGLPVISYYDATAGDLRVAHCAAAACNTGASIAIPVPGSLDVGQYTSIAIGLGGYPVISHYESGRALLWLARCNDIACASSLARFPDPLFNNGAYTSLAIGVDGLPIVSYHSASGALKVARVGP
jgi:hypothetical protein